MDRDREPARRAVRGDLVLRAPPIARTQVGAQRFADLDCRFVRQVEQMRRDHDRPRRQKRRGPRRFGGEGDPLRIRRDPHLAVAEIEEAFPARRPLLAAAFCMGHADERRVAVAAARIARQHHGRDDGDRLLARAIAPAAAGDRGVRMKPPRRDQARECDRCLAADAADRAEPGIGCGMRLEDHAGLIATGGGGRNRSSSGGWPGNVNSGDGARLRPLGFGAAAFTRLTRAKLVDPNRIELSTSSLRTRRSPN